VTDKQLQEAVQDELAFEPGIRSTDIGVTVRDGVVTLTGFVDSYTEKFDAERVAKRVFGVKALANDLEVRLPWAARRSDPEIAEAAVRALEMNTSVPKDRVRVTVRDGVIILEGEVDWKYQSMAAEDAVRYISGVRDVRNRIAVQPVVSVADVKSKIEEALRRSAEVEARRITVEAENGRVILRGNVHSWHERNAALNAAWRAPGVTEVQDRLVVLP